MDLNNAKDFLIIIGGISGILAFLWKIYDSIWAAFLSHLQIDLQLDKQKTDHLEVVRITSSVENKGTVSKKIAFAFVLIYSNKLKLEEVMQQITGSKSESFNLLIYEVMVQNHQKSKQVFDKSIVLYPLSYYYTRGSVGNEKLKFAFTQPLHELEANATYSVMFASMSKPLFGLFVRYRLLFDTFII